MSDNKYIASHIKQLVKERAQAYCEYCVTPASFCPDSFQHDHVIPHCLGGSSEEDNLAYSCGNCNAYKHTKTHHIDPLTGILVRLFHPRQHLWMEHFTWIEDDLMILGLTPIGRATVQLLKVNREGTVNLRSLLKLANLHPPAFSVRTFDRD